MNKTYQITYKINGSTMRANVKALTMNDAIDDFYDRVIGLGLRSPLIESIKEV